MEITNEIRMVSPFKTLVTFLVIFQNHYNKKRKDKW